MAKRRDTIQKRVRFDQLEVLEFPMILGDHPACLIGPPVQPSWTPSRRFHQSIDEYELSRSPRRELKALKFSSSERNEIILKMVQNPLNDSPRTAIRKACLEGTEERITELNERMDQLLTRMTMLDEDFEQSRRIRAGSRRRRRAMNSLKTPVL
eukprot:CAMPEP_0116996650 /NCGR_PEP_ID=MMETSP0472-20121206/385_1 /TAXON_ID=693140 ORGANISM="Tiarina fusus, Strain LIS" /NCGR_SAMPLE_ID=MMETSP0472 /ASSEMBLY_ACC=CAM_ASM_000603 /LENGTH=153 /DNA_ID=CAMNT_0004695341 /DNA_START=15 /DNA_END=476 /DNA_ORIENTATION=+